MVPTFARSESEAASINHHGRETRDLSSCASAARNRNLSNGRGHGFGQRQRDRVPRCGQAAGQAGTQTTYVFARAGNRLVRAVVRRFGWVLHHHINRELRADIRLVESLQIPPGPSLSGLTDRFDRPLVLRRRQHARRKAADNTTTPRDVPVTVTLRPQKQAAMHAHEK